MDWLLTSRIPVVVIVLLLLCPGVLVVVAQKSTGQRSVRELWRRAALATVLSNLPTILLMLFLAALGDDDVTIYDRPEPPLLAAGRALFGLAVVLGFLVGVGTTMAAISVGLSTWWRRRRASESASHP